MSPPVLQRWGRGPEGGAIEGGGRDEELVSSILSSQADSGKGTRNRHNSQKKRLGKEKDIVKRAER